jgi:hypothetical protein
MANIFFIHRFPFNKDAFIRDEFDYFISKGYNVMYLDISTLLKKKKLDIQTPPELVKYVTKFASKKAFSTFLKQNSNSSLIVTDVGLLLNSAWMYLAIFGANIPYVVFENAVLPNMRKKATLNDHKQKLTKIISRFNAKKITDKPIELLQFIITKIRSKPPKLAITSRPVMTSEMKTLCSKTTPIKYSVSLDYVLSTQPQPNVEINEEYAVFIDQYFVHHPDFKTKHIIHNFTAGEYYSELNKFLSNFSNQTKLKVVIASHPRRSDAHKNDFSPTFELYYNKTAALINGAKVVLLHFSTALNFVVLYNKPFILLDSTLFAKSNIQHKIEMFAVYFNKLPLNMTQPFASDAEQLENMLKVDSERYSSFIDRFIKHPKAVHETFRELIESALGKRPIQ